MHATAPAIMGVLALVPLTLLKPVLLVLCTVAVETPMASSSGFTRPSALGPSDEKLAIAPAPSTAPQLITCNASAGAMMVFVAASASCPSLPAAVRHTRPLAVAMFTASVVTAVWPSICDCVYQSM